jgi:hypothetical protein
MIFLDLKGVQFVYLEMLRKMYGHSMKQIGNVTINYISFCSISGDKFDGIYKVVIESMVFFSESRYYPLLDLVDYADNYYAHLGATGYIATDGSTSSCHGDDYVGSDYLIISLPFELTSENCGGDSRIFRFFVPGNRYHKIHFSLLQRNL